jgi:peptidoglycan/LPS O-acetylase OafA/YrhL
MLSTKSTSVRLASLDTARFLAAVGVVWIHACQTDETASWAAVGRFAVPFFSATAGYLSVLSLTKHAPASLWSFASSRFTRLYLPFLAWSIIYLLFKLTKKAVMPMAETDLPGLEFLIAGGAYHLWFIPFLLVTTFTIYAACKITGNRSYRQIWAANIAFIAGLSLAFALSFTSTPDTIPWFMAIATPSVLWGCAIGWANTSIAKDASSTSQPFSSNTRLALMAFITFLYATLMSVRDTRSILLESSSGAALLLAALFADRLLYANKTLSSLNSKIASLGKVSLGIYFSHLLFLKIGEIVASKVAPSHSAAVVILIAFSSIVSATILSLVAARFRSTKWLVT